MRTQAKACLLYEHVYSIAQCIVCCDSVMLTFCLPTWCLQRPIGVDLRSQCLDCRVLARLGDGILRRLGDGISSIAITVTKQYKLLITIHSLLLWHLAWGREDGAWCLQLPVPDQLSLSWCCDHLHKVTPIETVSLLGSFFSCCVMASVGSAEKRRYVRVCVLFSLASFIPFYTFPLSLCEHTVNMQLCRAAWIPGGWNHTVLLNLYYWVQEMAKRNAIPTVLSVNANIDAAEGTLFAVRNPLLMRQEGAGCWKWHRSWAE